MFEGSETSERSYLLRDSLGRFMSRLVIANMSQSHAGVYTCQPAAAPSANVTVHVLKHAVMAVSDGKKTYQNIHSHLNRDQIESNLSVCGIQGCYENYESFHISPHLIYLYVTINITLGFSLNPDQIQRPAPKGF